MCATIIGIPYCYMCGIFTHHVLYCACMQLYSHTLVSCPGEWLRTRRHLWGTWFVAPFSLNAINVPSPLLLLLLPLPPSLARGYVRVLQRRPDSLPMPCGPMTWALHGGHACIVPTRGCGTGGNLPPLAPGTPTSWSTMKRATPTTCLEETRP